MVLPATIVTVLAAIAGTATRNARLEPQLVGDQRHLPAGTSMVNLAVAMFRRSVGLVSIVVAASACGSLAAMPNANPTPVLPTSTAALPTQTAPLPTGTTDPYAGLPSNACGGFHLKVVNNRRAAVRVALDAQWSTVIPAQSTDTLVEFLPPPKPPLPWHVAITDETIGEQLFAATMCVCLRQM